MLAQQLSRRLVHPASTWPHPGTNVCAFCRIANAPSVLRRYYAKPVPRRAPSTRDREWAGRARIMTEEEKNRLKTQGGGKLLPSLVQVERLKNSGLITSDAPKVMELLYEMQKHDTRLDGPTAKSLCAYHEIPLNEMTYIARACLYHDNPISVRVLGKQILLAMSANEVPEATLRLLRTAAKQDKDITSPRRRAYDSSELALARLHLRKLVDARHAEAMVFQAQRLAADGKKLAAIDMLRNAIDKGATESQQYDDDAENLHKKYSGHFMSDIETTKSESPWTMLAVLERSVGNLTEALEAFHRGAFDDDDPKAFQWIAGTVPEYSHKWVEWITKAAASGSWEAAKKLGQFYTAPLETIPEKDIKEEMRRLEEHRDKIDWWYYYLSDWELESMGAPLGSKLVGADFWRPYKDPDYDADLLLVELNRRQALAMEWYEVAWRGQYCFSDETRTEINDAMQKIIKRAEAENKLSRQPQRSWWKIKARHRDSHHAAPEMLVSERISLEFQEYMKKFRG